MKINKLFIGTVLLLIAISLLDLSCSDCDNCGDKTNVSNNNHIYDDEDSDGNLLIKNYADQPLALYRGDRLIKRIPDNSEDYLIDIPNPNNNTVDLKIYNYDGVKNDFNAPNEQYLFKRWNIVLSSDNEEEHRVTWFIFSENIETESGLVTISYVGGSENSVDILLNSRNGALIASLSPGQYIKKIGIDYGVYTIHYRYWYSDPSTSDGTVERGWIETEIVNQNEVSIYLVLNDARKNRYIQVPNWNGGQPSDKQYGNIRIENRTSVPIQIWVGNELIENVMYTNDVVDNYSTISANESIVYTLKVDNYIFLAETIDDYEELTKSTISIKSTEESQWFVN